MPRNCAKRAEKFLFELSDGEIVEMDEETLNLSSVLREMISAADTNDPKEIIKLRMVNSRIFNKILEWAQLHLECIRLDDYKRKFAGPKNILDEVYAKSMPKDEPYKLEAWQTNFLDLDSTTLHDLLLASNYLHIKELMDMCCKFIASKIVGKTTLQIRQIFNIANDYTPEEEEKLRQEFKYCDDQDF